MGNGKSREDHGGSSSYAYENPVSATSTAIITTGTTTNNNYPESNGRKLPNGGPQNKEIPTVNGEMRLERLTSISKVEIPEVEPDTSTNDDTRFGWLWCRPRFLQFFNNPVGYCVLLCMVALIQGMTAFGFVYIGLSTLEKRFYFNSIQTGSISSTYDISTLLVAVFVSYMGEKGHRPLWVGFGSMIFSAGSIVFAIPHFVTPNYEYQKNDYEFCGSLNDTDPCDDVTNVDTNLSSYFWVFVFAQILHGLGASSLYTLGVTYIDENVPTRHFGIYMGIFNAVNIAGPALGYIIGGAYLTIYTDLSVDMESLTIDPFNPLWVGAWWLGFLVNGILLFVITLLYMGFPKALPGGKEVMKDRKFETQDGREFDCEDGALNHIKALPRAIWNLITNLPFMFLNGAAVMEFFLVAGLAVFGPKFMESQLNMTPSESAYAFGIIAATGGITGAILGGLIMNRLDLKFAGLVKQCLVACVLSVFLSAVFLAVCPTVDFAGVTVQYENITEPREGIAQLNATCNSQCVCPRSFDPVCGTDGIMYYSACHAGCDVQFLDDGNVLLRDCQCVIDPTYPTGHGSAVPRTCPTNCSYKWLYFIAFFLTIMLGGASTVAGWTATMRCVSHSQRAFALGIQTLIYGTLGTVPGPIVFGALIDRTCLLWEYSCDGAANCWLYDNAQSAHFFLLLSVSSEILGAVFFILTLMTYKPVKDQSEEEGVNGAVTSSVNQPELVTRT